MVVESCAAHPLFMEGLVAADPCVAENCQPDGACADVVVGCAAGCNISGLMVGGSTKVLTGGAGAESGGAVPAAAAMAGVAHAGARSGGDAERGRAAPAAAAMAGVAHAGARSGGDAERGSSAPAVGWIRACTADVVGGACGNTRVVGPIVVRDWLAVVAGISLAARGCVPTAARD